MVTMKELKELESLVKKLNNKARILKKEKEELSRQGFTIRYVKCGKETCRKCKEGRGHGPYIYKSVREGERVKSVYLGKLTDVKEIDKQAIDALKRIDEEIQSIEQKLNNIKTVINILIKDIRH